MASPRTLTWLHLSDLHRCSTRDGGGGEIVLERLLDDLKKLRDEEDLRPDLVFMTGDLAFGQIREKPLAEQLEEGWEWLGKVRVLYGLGVNDLFLVPGNHDIDRGRVKKKEQLWLRTLAAGYEKKEVYDLLQDGGDEWRDYMKRLADFEAFLAKHCPHLYDDGGRCIYGVRRLVAGLRVGIAGFNSAWSCGTKDDKANLWLGEWQIDKLVTRLMNTDVRIALVHHPCNWLVTAEDADLVPRFQTEFHVLLHGHEHKLWVQTPQRDHLHVAAGAVLDRAGSVLSYNMARFDLEEGTGEVWLRCLDPDTKKWMPKIVPEKTQGAGIWFVEIPWKVPKRQVDEKDWTLRDIEPGFRDDFLSRVEDVCRLREGEQVRIDRQNPIAGMNYLRVLRRDGTIIRDYAVTAVEGADEKTLDGFLRIQRRYRHFDPGVVSYLVCRKPPPAGLVQRAEKERVRLVSFVEYQGLIEFGPYVEQQTNKLESDPIYNPRYYVEQRIRYRFADQDRDGEAVETITEWLRDTRGHFILVLGDFGTGKTFLLHELARRLGHEAGFLTPVLIEMRDLEKGRTLDELAAQHFARAGMERLDFKAFRYMLREGRIALLFDGFDELALRVTYERATEHFTTLVDAAQGDAKVVVTSRTQHFESDAQVRTSLGDRVGLMAGHRIVHLRKFDEAQIRSYLVKRLADEATADRRFKLIERIKDLMGLSQVPRMLGFITDLPEADLLEAEKKAGSVRAADLYQLLLDRWIGHEVKRQEPRGGTPVLTEEERWAAIDKLALRLWERTERSVSVLELAEEAATLEALAASPITTDIAAHQVGSGTLLVRDAEGMFSFVHQSILEWLVARRAALQLEEKGTSKTLGVRTMSPLMAEFFRDLIGVEAAQAWVDAALEEDDETIKQNALVVRERLEVAGVQLGTTLRLAGEDLRGQDFSNETLDGAHFEGADLTSAKLVASSLQNARLSKAKLINTDLTGSDLRDADLREAVLSRTRLLGADLRGADLSRSLMWRTKLVGARLDVGALAEVKAFGVALPDQSWQPWYSLKLSTCKSIAWYPLREVFATGHDDGIVRLWDALSGQEIRRLLGHQGGVWSVHFSPDGSRLASGSDDGTVCLWNAASGERVRTFSGHRGYVWSVCFSPDGSRLASSSYDKTVRLWDVDSGKEMAKLTGHQGSVRSVCFSPDGSHLASGSGDKTVRLWDAGSGQETARLAGHQGGVWSVCFSPDGSRLASGSGDNTVFLWDVGSGQETARLIGHSDWIRSLCFSPDGSRLASGSNDRTVHLWDPVLGKETARLTGHLGPVWSVCFSSDGSRLASGSDDDTVRLWDPGSAQETARLAGYEGKIWSLCFSPDGSRLASSSEEKTVRLWNPYSGQETARVVEQQHSVRSACFSPDGFRLAFGSGDIVYLWDLATLQETARLTGHQNFVRSVCFSPDGSRLASGADKIILLWDPVVGKRTARIDVQSLVSSLCFSPDGSRLASGSSDRTVGLWDPVSGDNVGRLAGHRSSVRSVCFSPDGSRLASGYEDHTVRLWDPISAEEILRLEGHQGAVLSLCFSPDGACFASGSSDRTVGLWDPVSGKKIAQLTGHQDAVSSVVFHPDGSYLASGSVDNTIRFWNVETGRCLAILVPLPEGWVAYTPEGRYKMGGETSGLFWHSIGLCRFEPGELDPYMELRVPDDEPLWRSLYRSAPRPSRRKDSARGSSEIVR